MWLFLFVLVGAYIAGEDKQSRTGGNEETTGS
jgi:hypothetical protein